MNDQSRFAEGMPGIRGGLLCLLLLPGLMLWQASAACAQQFGSQAVFAGEEPAAPSDQPEATQGESAAVDPEAMAEQALSEEQQAADRSAQGGEEPAKLSLWQLGRRGGKLMLPILAMSVLVVAFGIERVLALRRHKVLPPELIDGLGRLASQKGGLDPRRAYKLCQQYPSAAANVIKVMLLKVGRPHSEVEHAVTEANQREAARLYSNVRWLTLAAGVTPLMGLLGTVWGMIQAFIVTANMPMSQNRTELLAEGIYVALVTTLFGLSVAIPAAILAHFLEGRIQGLLRELDEMLLGLLPQLERFEGRLRVTKEALEPTAGGSLHQELASAQAGGPSRPSSDEGPKQPATTPK